MVTDNSRTRGLVDAAKRTKTKLGESPVASASCPVRESFSPRVGNPRVGVSASCPVRTRSTSSSWTIVFTPDCWTYFPLYRLSQGEEVIIAVSTHESATWRSERRPRATSERMGDVQGEHNGLVKFTPCFLTADHNAERSAVRPVRCTRTPPIR